MPNFEVIPGNPRIVLQYQIENLIPDTGFESTVLESTDERIRISIVTPQDVGTGMTEHGMVLRHLQNTIDYLTDDNSRVIKHSSGSFNIEIDCNGLFDSQV